MNLNKQNLINKIKYRSQYRGTKEMDIFLSSFVNNIIKNLDFNELKDLNKLVNLNDEQIIQVSKGLLKINVNKKIIKFLIDFK